MVRGGLFWWLGKMLFRDWRQLHVSFGSEQMACLGLLLKLKGDGMVPEANVMTSSKVP